MTHTTHTAPVLAAAALILLAACSSNPPSTTATPSPHPKSPTPSASGSAPPIAAAPGPTNAGSFDAVHAAQVLGPSVGLVISTGVSGARGGAAEGSGFVFSSQGGTSYMLTNNHVVQGARRVQVVMPDGRHYSVEVQGTDQIED